MKPDKNEVEKAYRAILRGAQVGAACGTLWGAIGIVLFCRGLLPLGRFVGGDVLVLALPLFGLISGMFTVFGFRFMMGRR
jgi:hypothetical protein